VISYFLGSKHKADYSRSRYDQAVAKFEDNLMRCRNLVAFPSQKINIGDHVCMVVTPDYTIYYDEKSSKNNEEHNGDQFSLFYNTSAPEPSSFEYDTPISTSLVDGSFTISSKLLLRTNSNPASFIICTLILAATMAPCATLPHPIPTS
jgi:hypothetical protein